MRNTLLIALREFVENAKTKGFWIGIFMLPLIMVIGIGVSTKLARSEPSRHFVVIDQSGAFVEAIDHSIEWEYQKSVLQALGQYAQENARPDKTAEINVPTYDAAVDAFIATGGKDAFLAKIRPLLRDNAPAFKDPARRFVRVDLPKDINAGASAATITGQLRPYLVGEKQIVVGSGHEPLFAALLIKPDGVEGAMRWTGEEAIQYWSTNLAVNDLPQEIQKALNSETRRRLYVARGVDAGQVRTIEQTWARLGTFDPNKAAGQETVSIADRIKRSVPLGFVYLLWMSIFTVMQMLLNNTIEEKSNRIAEVLLSSVTPHEIMMGKLLGIAGIGLTMVGAWLGTVFIGLRFWQGPGAAELSQALDAVAASGLIPTFLLCFLLGYLIYAGLFLSIGALCNDIKEAQSFQGPLMLIMMVPFFTMTFINRDPHGTLATILTWIPLYTPFTLMNRAAANPPMLEIVGATLLMIVTALLFLWSAGRIFRIGMLRAGNRPKLAEVVQWIRGGKDA